MQARAARSANHRTAIILAGGDRAALRLAVLLQAALPGAPCIYYGDEIGLEGRQDPDNRAAFPADESRWDGAQLAFTRAVLTLRHAAPALRRGDLRVVAAVGGAVVIERGLDGEHWIVAVNAAERPSHLELRLSDHGGGLLEPHPLPGWRAPVPRRIAADGRTELIVPARSGIAARIR